MISLELFWMTLNITDFSDCLAVVVSIIITVTIPWEFFPSDGLPLQFDESTSPQVSRTFFSILADLNNAVVWMVSIYLLFAKFSSSFINPLVTVPKAPITIGINVIFMFYSFFIFYAKSRYISFFSLSYHFTQWSSRIVHNLASSIFVNYYKVRSSGLD